MYTTSKHSHTHRHRFPGKVCFQEVTGSSAGTNSLGVASPQSLLGHSHWGHNLEEKTTFSSWLNYINLLKVLLLICFIITFIYFYCLFYLFDFFSGRFEVCPNCITCHWLVPKACGLKWLFSVLLGLLQVVR